MNNWRVIELKEIGEFRNGANYPKGSYGSGDKIVNVKDLFKGRFVNYENLDELKQGALNNKMLYTVQHGDLLFTRSSLVKSGAGMVAMINEPEGNILFCGFIIRFRPDLNKVYSLFLLYLLRSPNYRKIFTDGSVQTNISNINQETLGGFKVSLPDFTTQKSIAKILSDLDAKIELNNRINRELEAMAKTIYDYWFVQFDFPAPSPSGRAGVGLPYKSSGGKMVYHAELKREIPEGWDVKSIAEWIKNNKNGDWGREAAEGNYQLKVSCIRGADLNGLNGNGELKSPTRFILANNSNKLLENHDLIVEISGGSPTQSTGRLGFITEETLSRFANPLICSNFCKAITLKNEKYLFNFFYQWHKLYDNGVLFGWEGKTSGIKNLLFESFITNQKEVYPSSEIVQKFYDFAKPIHSQIQKNLKQNRELSTLRDWLLPMLMNGQVSVQDVA